MHHLECNASPAGIITFSLVYVSCYIFCAIVYSAVNNEQNSMLFQVYRYLLFIKTWRCNANICCWRIAVSKLRN